MTQNWSKALLVLVLSGCSSDAPPGATIAQEKTLTTSSSLASLANVSLIRAGDGFILAGYDSGTVRWARLSLAGDLVDENNFALPEPMLAKPRPVFAVTQNASPADQLIAISITDSTAKPGSYDLIAVAQTVGDANAATPVVLANLDDVTDPGAVQVVAGAAISGKVGFVAWGVHEADLHIPVNFYMLPAGAAVKGDPVKAFDAKPSSSIPLWDCLSPAANAKGLGFGVVIPGSASNKSAWRTIDLDESGGTMDMTYPLDAQVTSCQVTSSLKSKNGYLLAFQAGTAIDYASYQELQNDPGNGNVTTYKSVLPATMFGGAVNLPSVGWIAPAGKDVSIGVSRPSGPQVFRFTYDAVPHGGTLTLRSRSGNTGPVASWVGPDGVYVTYTDRVASSGANAVQRYFVKVQSPDELP